MDELDCIERRAYNSYDQMVRDVVEQVGYVPQQIQLMYAELRNYFLTARARMESMIRGSLQEYLQYAEAAALLGDEPSGENHPLRRPEEI